eukprot:1150373-Pelagomonas_calceolata.AAC.9
MALTTSCGSYHRFNTVIAQCLQPGMVTGKVTGMVRGGKGVQRGSLSAQKGSAPRLPRHNTY